VHEFRSVRNMHSCPARPVNVFALRVCGIIVAKFNRNDLRTEVWKMDIFTKENYTDVAKMC
jgi:hypothetical protein